MIIATVLGVCACCAVLFFLYLVKGSQAQIRSMSELVTNSRPVDVDAFRNLVSQEEEQFLRSRLSAADFRAVQRARMEAALEYVHRTSHNAVLLLQIARMARDAPLPETARAAQRLGDQALQMRVFSMIAACVIRARIIAPGLTLRPVAIVERYERLRESMSGLLRVQVPTAVSRVDAAL